MPHDPNFFNSPQLLGNNIIAKFIWFDIFSQKLTMLRFPDDKVCYIFPLLNQQSTPEELIRDLEKAKQVRTKNFMFCDKTKFETSFLLQSHSS